MSRNTHEAVVDNQLITLKKNVEILELKARRLTAMQTLQVLEIEQAVDALSTIEYCMTQLPPDAFSKFVEARDGILLNWKVDPIKYKDYCKNVFEAMDKEKKPASTLHIVPSAETSKEEDHATIEN